MTVILENEAHLLKRNYSELKKKQCSHIFERVFSLSHVYERRPFACETYRFLWMCQTPIIVFKC